MPVPNPPQTSVRKVNPNFFTSTSGQKFALWYDSSNGDYFIAGEVLGAPTPFVTPIMKNGTWYSPAIQISDLYRNGDPNSPTELRNQLDAKAKAETKQAFINIGGNAGGFKLNPSINSTQILTQNSAQGTSAGIASIAGTQFSNPPGQGNIFDNPNIIDYGTNMKDLFKTPLAYPIDIRQNQQDILVITQYSYKPPYSDVITGKQKDNIFQNGAQRQSALQEKIQSVTLPIPNNVSDSNSAAWGDDGGLSAVQMGAMANIPDAAVASIASATSSTILGALGKRFGGKAGQDIASELGKAASPELLYTLLNLGTAINPATRAAIESMLLNRVGFNISPETILSRGYGVVPNSNIELLFTGPSLRGFSFEYLMTPRSKNEANMCRQILRFFKQGMAPKKKEKDSTGYGNASFFLATPNVFKLEYRTYNPETKKTEPIKGLNKFKICALTNLQTSYAEGAWAAYEAGQPARMRMGLAFKELEPVYESDYQETASNNLIFNSDVGVDQDKVLPDEIGY